MTISKNYSDGKFAYCSKCMKRVNRVYQREKMTGQFIPFGWYCNRCKLFTSDEEKYEVL